jgi:hypothetical protein
MCRLFSIVSVVLVLATIASLSPAVAARYCLRGSNWGYPGNCQFTTLQQCRASASGTNAYCGVNPRYAFARQRPAQQ